MGMTPKHERLIERMMDALWSFENSKRAITDPERMTEVVACICAELRKQPRSIDDMGALEWAAAYLERRLEEDQEPP